MVELFRAVDKRIIKFLADIGPNALRISLGIIFFWFGMLKFFPGLSSAQNLAADTISWLTFGYIGQAISLPVLAGVETLIGVGLITGIALRGILLLLAFQMAGTFLPLFIFPDLTWQRPFVPTLEGQYIIKNIVLITGALVVGATVRGKLKPPA